MSGIELWMASCRNLGSRQTNIDRRSEKETGFLEFQAIGQLYTRE
jgi:hypothetical protein